MEAEAGGDAGEGPVAAALGEMSAESARQHEIRESRTLKAKQGGRCLGI